MQDPRFVPAAILALALPLCCGGGPESRPQQELGAAPAEPQALPRASQAGPAPELEAVYRARSAAAVGWDSEAFQSDAGSRLKKLLALWQGATRPQRDDLAAWVLSDGTFDLLRPDELAVVRDGEDFLVRRLAPAGERAQAGRGAEGLLRAVDSLRAAFDATASWSVLVKIVGVELDGAHAVTRVLVQIQGPRGERVVDTESRWNVAWSLRPGEPALLAGIALVDLEESRGPAGGALFGEISAAVLGGTSAFDAQLMVPLDTWAGRIDRALGMSLIGHEGLAVGDADGDGDDDIYVCQPAGLPNLLFLRQAEGTAREAGAAAGVDLLDSSRSALFVDLDGDGDQELLVEADQRYDVFANDGSGRFEPRATLPSPSTTSMAAADFDLDGDLDLYACGYILHDELGTTPQPYHDAENGRPNRLWRNDGDWDFADVTVQVGLDVNNRRFSLAAAWEDYDDDGDPDLYVANDFGRNNLYRNDGGRFVDAAAEAGVEDMAASMGITWLDVERDGDLDLYVGNMFSSAGERVTTQRRFMPDEDSGTIGAYRRHARGNSLFENVGDGTFRDVSELARVTAGRWAWGTIAHDLDGDGWRDLFVPNGFVTGDDPEDL